VWAMASYEPGSSFPFPEGEVPAGGVGMPLADFMRLTKIPIVPYYGDNMPEGPVKEPGRDLWRRLLGTGVRGAEAVSGRGRSQPWLGVGWSSDWSASPSHVRTVAKHRSSRLMESSSASRAQEGHVVPGPTRRRSAGTALSIREPARGSLNGRGRPGAGYRAPLGDLRPRKEPRKPGR
jgi:hypothetical protein